MKNERKEELKDEMKNRISLALKDPILQQGFEIICKENAELKKKKEEIEIMTNFCKACKKMHTDQLTKAKEILKGIIDTPMYYQMGGDMYESEEYKELIAEAEQFLKEE